MSAGVAAAATSSSRTTIVVGRPDGDQRPVSHAHPCPSTEPAEDHRLCGSRGTQATAATPSDERSTLVASSLEAIGRFRDPEPADQPADDDVLALLVATRRRDDPDRSSTVRVDGLVRSLP